MPDRTIQELKEALKETAQQTWGQKHLADEAAGWLAGVAGYLQGVDIKTQTRLLELIYTAVGGTLIEEKVFLVKGKLEELPPAAISEPRHMAIFGNYGSAGDAEGKFAWNVTLVITSTLKIGLYYWQVPPGGNLREPGE